MPDPISLLNQAYKALRSEDRDEMEVWDCTIKDGLEDEGKRQKLVQEAVVFGAALDGLDDPERVGLKLAYVKARAEGRLPRGLPRDPYDALAPALQARANGQLQLSGKVKVPGWLCPRPGPRDLARIRPEQYREFMDSEGPATLVKKCAERAAEILPRVPVMIAVDHGLAAGPLAALSRKFSAESLAVVVLDSHFDAIPARLRAPAGLDLSWNREGLCGDFLAKLIREGTVLPENLFVIGVSDFPPPEASETPYGRAYLSLIASGVKVFTRDEALRKNFGARLREELGRTRARRLYVSLDADVGAGQGLNAVRYIDAVGLPRPRVLEIARLLRRLIQTGRFTLAGADVCEVDVHLLDLPDPEGNPDRTIVTCAEFLATLWGERT